MLKASWQVLDATISTYNTCHDVKDYYQILFIAFLTMVLNHWFVHYLGF